MFFSVGAHPGFNIPLYENEKFEDYYILFEKKETKNRRIKANGLLSGEQYKFLNNENMKQLEHSFFYNGAIIMEKLESSWLEIRNNVNSKAIRVNFEGFPYLGIWSAANDAPFLCIEPWFGLDSKKGDSLDLFAKEGLQKLAAGKIFECTYSIEIKD